MKNLRLLGTPAIWPKGRWKETILRPGRIQLRGFFEWELVHARTGLIARRGRGENMIVNQGLNFLGGNFNSNSVAGGMTDCGVGTGTDETVATMTALQSEVFRTNASGGFQLEHDYNAAGGYTYGRRTRVFTQAQANGNLSEVGMFYDSSGDTLFCRQLIRDELGAPTTITKTSDYELRVTYEVRWYIPPDEVYDATINGALVSITSRPAAVAGVSQFSAWWAFGHMSAGVNASQDVALVTGNISADVTGMPSGTYRNRSNITRDPYVNHSYERTFSAQWLAAVANDTNYNSIVTMGQSTAQRAYGTTQHQLPAPVSKINTQRFDLYWTQSWGRYVAP